jgi:putative addiction module component (TIGR02574 family)
VNYGADDAAGFGVALALSTQERGLLIDRLVETLDNDPAEEGVEAASDEEIKRRVDDIRSRRVKTIPGDQLLREIAKRFSNREYWWPLPLLAEDARNGAPQMWATRLKVLKCFRAFCVFRLLHIHSVWLIKPACETNLATDSTDDKHTRPESFVVRVKNDPPPDETDQPRNSEREPTPIEFINVVRELFRETKQFIVFIRDWKNANAAPWSFLLSYLLLQLLLRP